MSIKRDFIDPGSALRGLVAFQVQVKEAERSVVSHPAFCLTPYFFAQSIARVVGFQPHG